MLRSSIKALGNTLLKMAFKTRINVVLFSLITNTAEGLKITQIITPPLCQRNDVIDLKFLVTPAPLTGMAITIKHKLPYFRGDENARCFLRHSQG